MFGGVTFRTKTENWRRTTFNSLRLNFVKHEKRPQKRGCLSQIRKRKLLA